MLTEADTCRKYVLPKLREAGWEDPPHFIQEQKTFTDGRIVVGGNKARRRPQKRADYLLRYTRDFLIAVVEAKAVYKSPSDGLQQAKDYAQILDLRFAYSTNGKGIIEYDFTTGVEKPMDTFPTPEDLWARLRAAEGQLDPQKTAQILEAFHLTGKTPRYYQEIAIRRAVEAILKGRRRVLLTMATGTGKTFVAFQICWKLWSGRWNAEDEFRRPKILYLADRNILVDEPKDKMFAAFGDARCKIEGGVAPKSREMYFAIYQALARDEVRPGLYREYPPDFFDLILVDECHRGSASDDSNWREILEYFQPAYQLGMTATPLREDNKDTYRYFGNPVYEYSLRQGIEDGFLAPYRVHRVVTSFDATGWRPSRGEQDLYGRAIPDEVFLTPEFETVLSLEARTQIIARHLTEFLKRSSRYDKTIVFCVDQEHADQMRRALGNVNADLMKKDPDYVVRITSDDQEIGLGHLSRFQDPERRTPALVTTSRLLSTGVDVPTCRNVVLVRVIRSMTEFKQIIGRGTRVNLDHDKLFFNILDYAGSTRLFADPDFDGTPALITETELDDEGQEVPGSEKIVQPEEEPADQDVPVGQASLADDDEGTLRKFYVRGGEGRIAAHIVQDLDTEGRQLRVVEYTAYVAREVRTLAPTAEDLRERWADPAQRVELMRLLEDHGIAFDELRAALQRPDADPFDLLCHLAYNAPVRSRRDRAQRLRAERKDFFDHYAPQARAVLEALLDKYAEHGATQFTLPDVLKVPPLSELGNVAEIIDLFGGADQLRDAVQRLQSLLYVA
jgi:type I restriction enzyme, R subunit